MHVISKERNYAINTVLVAIFVFDTHVTEQRNRMIKCRKSCKENGHEWCELFNNRMDFKTEMGTNLYLQNKINRKLPHTSPVSRSSISHS